MIETTIVAPEDVSTSNDPKTEFGAAVSVDFNELLKTEMPELSALNESALQAAGETETDVSVDQLELIPFHLKNHEFIEVTPSENLERDLKSIPAQMAFKIGTVADLVGVKPYVLRFWESEFEALRPKKSQKGQRAYTKRDVETAMMIKKLLYEDRFSIEGARSKLRELRTKIKEARERSAPVSTVSPAPGDVAVAGLAQAQDRVRQAAITELKSILADISRFSALFSA